MAGGGARGRRDGRARGAPLPGGVDTTSGGGRLVIALAVVAAVLVLLVAWTYWPPWIADLAGQTLDWLADGAGRIWRQTGGRWVTLLALAIATCLGLLLLRRSRVAGLTIIEVAIALAAAVALIQPGGW